ncbi:hypothetical protein [Pseudoalteromonas sp. Of11M-6]|uniref:hypothetical protein n=1 Tax=Pseudoalteromonas sp. Of11M-6 TaxID=2917754 RepID=UPI001EF7415F|nr:hypothetical protein [Pseudoalteromonas sp. Of11M-6]MCG7556073.1 hypothetical protein [Pseudoalteromonas sp. Of11M-6]
MNTFSYIEKRLIELGQERKVRLVHASNDDEELVINSFYSGAKNELELLRDELMNHVTPVDDELPEKHIINHSEMS